MISNATLMEQQQKQNISIWAAMSVSCLQAARWADWCLLLIRHIYVNYSASFTILILSNDGPLSLSSPGCFIYSLDIRHQSPPSLLISQPLKPTDTNIWACAHSLCQLKLFPNSSCCLIKAQYYGSCPLIFGSRFKLKACPGLLKTDSNGTHSYKSYTPSLYWNVNWAWAIFSNL